MFVDCFVYFSEFSIRLVSKNNTVQELSDNSYGRVEVFHNGIWGGICQGNRNFTQLEADAICRSMGYV